MSYKILVKKDTDKVTARAVLFPDVVVTGTDEATVLEQIRNKLMHLLEGSRFVELDLTSAETDPWLQFAGMWSDDRDWDIFQAEVKAYRDSFDAVPE